MIYLNIFRLLKAYRKIHKFSHVISYFSTQQWRFKNNNVLALWDRINPTDRVKFDFNLDNLDWNDYFYYYVRGLRLYILKDPLNTVEAGKAKYRRWVTSSSRFLLHAMYIHWVMNYAHRIRMANQSYRDNHFYLFRWVAMLIYIIQYNFFVSGWNILITQLLLWSVVYWLGLS